MQQIQNWHRKKVYFSSLFNCIKNVCANCLQRASREGWWEREGGGARRYIQQYAMQRKRALELLIKCSVLFYENCGSYPALSINIPVRFLFFLSLFLPPPSLSFPSLFFFCSLLFYPIILAGSFHYI